MIFFYSYLVLLVICFISGIILTWHLKWTLSPVKLLPWFVLLTFISETLALRWAIKYHNNHHIYNIYGVIQFIFYSFALYQMIKNGSIKKLLKFISLGFSVLSITNLCFIQGMHHLNSINFYGGAIILAFFSGYSLSELFRKTDIGSPFKIPDFWIGSGTLVLNSCMIPLILPSTLSLTLTPGEAKMIIGMIMVVNVIVYTMFTISFIHLYKNNKPSTLWRRTLC